VRFIDIVLSIFYSVSYEGTSEGVSLRISEKSVTSVEKHLNA